jgi:hypothetical protein
MNLNEFLNSPAGYALQAALVAAFLDFAFGTFAALRDGVFALDSVAAFVRKHLMGRVFPIGTLAVMGYLSGNLAMNMAAAAALTAYATETLASIYGSIRVPDKDPATAIPTD